MDVRPWTVVVMGSLLFGGGCTYGPIQQRAAVWTIEERFNTHTFAVALDRERHRDPTGLSRFPDGGAPRTLDEDALFYVCDADSHSARLLARVPRTREMESGFSGWILGWGDGCFYARVSGRRYSWRHGAVGPWNQHLYRVGLDGSCIRLEAIPAGVSRQPETGGRLPGETTFLRASAREDRIDLRLHEGAAFVAWFAIHPDGTITPIGSM